MRYKQKDQTFSEATIVNVGLALLLAAIVVLTIIVKTWEVTTVKKECRHCLRSRKFVWWELFNRNCYSCRQELRIAKYFKKKYGGG